MSKQIETIKSTYQAKLKEDVENEVAKRTGRKPSIPTDKIDNPLGYNPYARETFNLSAIIKLETETPEIAKALEGAVKK